VYILHTVRTNVILGYYVTSLHTDNTIAFSFKHRQVEMQDMIYIFTTYIMSHDIIAMQNYGMDNSMIITAVRNDKAIVRFISVLQAETTH